MYKYQKGLTSIAIISMFLVLIVIVGASYFFINRQNNIGEQFLYEYSPNAGEAYNIFYLFDVSSKKQTEVPIGQEVKDICFNEGKLYYSNGGTVLSYNFKNNSSKIVSNIPNSFMSFYYLSSDCQYAILDAGTSTGNRARGLYDIKNNKAIEIPRGSGMDVVWSPNNDKFVLVAGTIDFWTGADQTLNSIYLEEIEGDKVKENLILSATNTEFYRPIKWVDNDILMYEKDTFSDYIKTPIGIDWKSAMDFNNNLYDARKIEYFVINIDTMVISPATETLKNSINDQIVIVSPSGKHKITVKENGEKYYVSNYYDINLSKIDGSDNFLVTSKHFLNQFIMWLPTR